MTTQETIRAQVLRRIQSEDFYVREEWFTPSGRQRSAPMYECFIRNEYLKSERTIKGKTFAEAKRKSEDALNKWAEQEIKQRTRKAKADATEAAAQQCEEENAEAVDVLESLATLLNATLDVDDRIDWSELFDTSSPAPFSFDEAGPIREEYPLVPKPITSSFWEWLLPSKKTTRLNLMEVQELAHKQDCERIDANYEQALAAWNERRALAEATYNKQRARKKAEQDKHNQSIQGFKTRFEAGDPTAICEYASQVFERSSYPDAILIEHETSYDPASQTLVVDLSLPSLDEFPEVSGYKFIKSRNESKPILLKKKDREARFDDMVRQIILRTAHEVFESVYTPHVQAVVVNGWVTFVDRATGQEQTSCIISLSSDREEFEAIDLSRVEPEACFKHLKGLVAGPLAQLAPVQPLMQLDREDSRFVESRDVLADINSHTNLAEMPWEDFEHLVRDLFSAMFSGPDTDVRVTQTSSDGGVDAIAFDPDPIRGGKFVIQAKRYTKVVPVSAVRDLYGTMISEGATKGILVTTAHFGRDTHKFAKDKPISLINGENLVYLLEKQGHKVRIDIQSARRAR